METEAKLMDTDEKFEHSFDPGFIADRYSSVEIALIDSEPVYMFRIRNTPSSGVGILVQEDSAVLRHLKVGDKLNLKYNPVAASDLPEYLKTEIKYITEYDQKRPNKHYLVNFAVIEK
ncbi:MAG: hypothetical protein ISS65_02310 [Desulfobacterales bacterium]|uniref:PilZ domain-containing protein n=1 Tax=Candidatus Desulfatibia profunda TaxID=2841695 RepID=A0A8J6NUB4_9BACT|nr:hypothetical protein [Candidatus Desulfatibia profunda]MBL7179027.1 hypothetical protein [Desulfobacterales bacterium]